VQNQPETEREEMFGSGHDHDKSDEPHFSEREVGFFVALSPHRMREERGFWQGKNLGAKEQTLPGASLD
jgi:hypothetical protein